MTDEELCPVCGSREFVTHPSGWRRCARFFFHGAGTLYASSARCGQRTNITPLVRDRTGRYQKTSPDDYEYATCYRDRGHAGQHRADVVQRGAVFW